MRWTTPLSIAFLAAAAVGSLQGCATKPAAEVGGVCGPSRCGYAPPPPSCVAVKAYSADQLAQMAAAVRSLPAGSPLRGLVVDYQRLRDEARAACPQSAPLDNMIAPTPAPSLGCGGKEVVPGLWVGSGCINPASKPMP